MATPALFRACEGQVSWVQTKTGKACIAVEAAPKFGPTATVCGKTVEAFNVYWCAAPPLFQDKFVCAKCVAVATGQTRQQVLTQAVKRYAELAYETGGWDVIVECWGDDSIAETIGKATTVEGAIKKVGAIAEIYADQQADARNSAF